MIGCGEWGPIRGISTFFSFLLGIFKRLPILSIDEVYTYILIILSIRRRIIIRYSKLSETRNHFTFTPLLPQDISDCRYKEVSQKGNFLSLRKDSSSYGKISRRGEEIPTPTPVSGIALVLFRHVGSLKPRLLPPRYILSHFWYLCYRA